MKQITQSMQLANRAPLNSLSHPWFLGLAFAALLGSQVGVFGAENDPAIEAQTESTYVFRHILRENPIEAKSKDGIVTLTGTVDYESERQLAQATTTGVKGVKGVENKIEVKKGPAEHSDTWLFLKLKSTLAYHRSVSATGTTVEMKDGVATLKGVAANEAERDLVSEYAMDVEGVKGVKNEMTLAASPAPVPAMVESVDDASITAQIRMALLAHRSTSKLTILFSTLDGVVTLTGGVNNQAEHALVEKLVLDINGVRKVVNQLTVKQDAEVRN